MVSQRNKKRLFSGMGYREVQRSNSNRRSKLPKKEQEWLKESGYRNVGWDNVIELYQKINDLLSSSNSDEPSLEDLFLQADRIGNKYQTSEEIDAFNRSLRSEVEEISNQIDKQFPDSDSEYEFVDYSKQPRKPVKAMRKSST
ncbi:hypothetical protein IQ241_06495 [Romeria aff. gracilis LEGE 07310]|uniref:Uncharacterized protein n=1 Tax=Vasconcelosia minhoensis LEGE 07310 TaxID=915328 RepID=A0A8J7AW91_9CYAN|nr:hypothetical protein [Romeria gracilis]MBE9076947.1 hypothetical protein [Romeria aff. gracilis LEGE 07310]